MFKQDKLGSEESYRCFPRGKNFAKVKAGLSTAGIIEQVRLHPGHPMACVQEEVRLCVCRGCSWPWNR